MFIVHTNNTIEEVSKYYKEFINK